jgi:hypothetical protein
VLRGATLVAAFLAALAAGCGSSQTTKRATCPVPPRLAADLAAIERAAALPTKDTLKGTPAVNRATDAFLRDVETAPIGNLARNRLIDHAASALAGSCEQCFQALEAERPIVQIEHTGSSACS